MARKSFKKIDFTDAEVRWMKGSLMDEANYLMMKAEKMIHYYNLIANKRDLDGRFENVEIANACLEGIREDGEWDESEKELFEKLVPKEFREKRYLTFDFQNEKIQ